MAIQLDLRSPTVVVVGRWNEAILNEPGWVARHVLGLPEGQQIEVRGYLRQQEGMPPLQVWAFPRFALGCLGPRLELFQLSEQDDDGIYDALYQISNVLPHTPVSAIGINFRLFSEVPIPALSEKAETQEKFDEFGITRIIERADTIEISKEKQLSTDMLEFRQCRLKIARSTDYSGGIIDFNFHLDIRSISDIPSLIAFNPLAHWRAQRDQLLEATYGISELEAVTF